MPKQKQDNRDISQNSSGEDSRNRQILSGASQTGKLVRALHPEWDLSFVASFATPLAHKARELHELAASSAALLGQGLAAGTLLAALQKEESTRINIQLECSGPARGLFVDASPAGQVRGYIKNKHLQFPSESRFVAAPLLGQEGYLSVLRDRDGQFYRGSVDLEHKDLSLALESYYSRSEQIHTAFRLEALKEGDDSLAWVGGVLVQRLPDGDLEAFSQIRERLHSGIVERKIREGSSALALLEAVADSRLELLQDSSLEFYCPCSKERVIRALLTLSNLDIVEMITEDQKAEANCEFCSTRYVVSEDELREILAQIDERDARAERENG